MVVIRMWTGKTCTNALWLQAQVPHPVLLILHPYSRNFLSW
uniref:Uncharacterized protein n=1 Tax=Anguilla anguilla TaxID=7936 RepID=A0A0E9SY51_ANGAN